MRTLAVAALLLLALPASSPAQAPTVKQTRGWIETLAMDGSRAAYAVDGGAGCTKVFVWDVRTGGGAVASGQGTCAADSTSTGGGVTQIAVAGNRLAWTVNQGGNTESDDSLYTATLPAARERLLVTTVRTGDIDGTLTGGWIGGLVGSGDRIAVNRWTTDGQGNVVSGLPTLHAQALDQRRVAVLRADGKVALYDADTGRMLLTVAPSSARQVVLRKDYIVVLTRTKTVEIFNSRTGAPVRTLPVAAGARQLDVHSGIAVYAVGRNVHVLRLGDGATDVIARAPRAIEGLQIEAPGIVYAYNTVRGLNEVGNLAFVPLAKVNATL
jgi:hypothetical protein